MLRRNNEVSMNWVLFAYNLLVPALVGLKIIIRYTGDFVIVPLYKEGIGRETEFPQLLFVEDVQFPPSSPEGSPQSASVLILHEKQVGSSRGRGTNIHS